MMPHVEKHVQSNSMAATSSISSSMTTSPITQSIDSPGLSLWETQGAHHSIMLPYIRDHAEEMITRLQHENPRNYYVALKQVHDVCLYKRIKSTEMLPATSKASPSSSLLSKRGVSITQDSMDITNDFEFRGITRVPGSIDTVLNVLASETARENYWVALNTMKEIQTAALLSSARLYSPFQSTSITSNTEVDSTAFPRWSRKFLAAKFLKRNDQVLDCCYAEYATKYTETNNEGNDRQHGIVYRRSISEGALINTSSISAERLNKAKVPGATRIFIRNWLLDVVETQEPMICKLILTCTVFVPSNSGHGTVVLESDFREFCTQILVGTRRALTNQWINHAALTGIRSSLSWRRESRCCIVCSTQFSLLRKRYTCRSCGCSVCFKCCSKNFSSNFGSTMVSGARLQQRGKLKHECLLCIQFGPTSDSISSSVGYTSSRGRHLMTSPATISTSESRDYPISSRGREHMNIEQEDLDQAHPDLELYSTTSVTGSCSQRSVGSRCQRSISSQDDDDELDRDTGSLPPRTNMWIRTKKPKIVSDQKTTSSSGIFLLSELDKWTLSSNGNRMSGSFSSSYSQGNAPTRLQAKSAAPHPTALHPQKLQHRNDRAASENSVLLISHWPRNGSRKGPQESSYSTEDDEDVYSEDDLANFNLKLL
ncbi:Zinc finger, RING/FYVE/PHD-type [Plasmopara halstedii]|uniref:Zinc finger, RING/FYVE/PHD-type n=1 Tax=Plasmopara halstedii TaxID=4781 RepID=A0A0P1A6Y2_PLAHL|nr:Zinc finger, RING/FYVE/PHD-type [Plasmopara halstedii]CEG36185.1 Zinc finger, RING/FYVE/PHD-type [Plasmopara halstedii]|eukprot:XP_024572554.1 Zinc finger, RING/FYVE/PHD-type [Plasmopara halstedii]